MDLIKYFKMGFQKYADFSTRSTRSEFWWFQLGYFLLMIPFVVGAGVLGFISMDNINSNNGGSMVGVSVLIGVLVLFLIGTLIPQISLTVRRLHDAGQSGWMYLLTMVPYIGSIAWIVFGVLETQPRENKWGPVPGSEKKHSLKSALVDFDENDLI